MEGLLLRSSSASLLELAVRPQHVEMSQTCRSVLHLLYQCFFWGGKRLGLGKDVSAFLWPLDQGWKRVDEKAWKEDNAIL